MLSLAHPAPRFPTFATLTTALALLAAADTSLAAAEPSPGRVARPADPLTELERTCFQTGQGYDGTINLRSDVAIVYGIDPGLPSRIGTWRENGYRIHVMTGVSWGNYQDYLYGRFDGINHEDEAQTDRRGQKISHGGDVYYMCPGTNYGRFLSVGVRRALEAGAEAIHLEEPEFWVRGGYSEGFKREWQAFYGEPWQPPHSSPEAQWRASKLKYFLYRRALQQVFDFIQDWNKTHATAVRCYVPTHSLLNYAHWRIVSPESSLGRLAGCDGYIAQVWTGTARTPNVYRGQLRERTFETAFLEYGAMQNLVRATGRTVWYLNDPVEDNPDHDWGDYQRNWESTLVASLLQPEVWRYEVMPWPERIFRGRYPAAEDHTQRVPIPPAYATELQTVIRALGDLHATQARWDNELPALGVLVSDSLMFQRGEPAPGDPHLGHVYGLALPFLKRGIPIEPVQLENTTLRGCLDRYQVLLLTYHGMKPLDPAVHAALGSWVRQGGNLVIVDDDTDPYHTVREWWNSGAHSYRTPRQHLLEQLGLPRDAQPGTFRCGQGRLAWHQASPAALASTPDGDTRLVEWTRAVRPDRVRFPESNHLLLRRGPYVVAAGLDESPSLHTRSLPGAWVNLFDPTLAVRPEVSLGPGTRWFLLDLAKASRKHGTVLAAATRVWPTQATRRSAHYIVEGIANTPAVVLLRARRAPSRVTLAGVPVTDTTYDDAHRLLWVRFANQATPRELAVEW